MLTMKRRETLQRLQHSPEYRAMYREIIHTQIQTLIDHLTLAGVESVLLTACLYDGDVTENTTLIGTEVGQLFVNQENVQCKFKEFCAQKNHVTSEKILQSSPVPDLVVNKRKFSEISEDSSEAEQTTPIKMEYKRSRSLTPSLKLAKSPAAADTYSLPKGHVKCSLCSYVSKFKANVTRHERSVHRINIEGATLVTAQYTCALCEYKSTYRANLVRHEKSIHKVASSNAEIESRKIQLVQNGDGSSFTDAVLGVYDTDTGNPLYMNQTGSGMENIGDQSIENTGEGCLNISQIDQDSDLTDVELGNQTVVSDVNQSGVNENGSNTENFENQSNMETCDEEVENGCHICNYCQLIYNSKAKLLDHIDSAHPKTSLLQHERSFDSETGLITQNTPKQEVCKCGKAFQYRTSLMRHERKCEFLTSQENFLTTSQGYECKDECSEMLKTDISSVCDQNNRSVMVTEKEEINE